METKTVLINERREQNKNTSKNIFLNLKSDFFLQILFDNLQKKKSLEIVKYNKFIQQRININNDNYKDFSEKYSSIEIEIIPFENYKNQFIRILDKEKKYYHIYFNNNKGKEIKEYYLNKKEKITNITVIIDYQVESFGRLFELCSCIKSINFKKFYRKNITKMNDMFYFCGSVKEINFSNCNTDNVTHMNSMFNGCTSLKKLNISNFNTNNVTDMNNMFRLCSSLTELNLSNFNTDNVVDMSDMFSECPSLEKLYFSNENKITNFFLPFFECPTLKELNPSNFNTNRVVDMSYTFYLCTNLNEINLCKFNINKEINIGYIFEKYLSSKDMNLSQFNIHNKNDMKYMFFGCSEDLTIKIKSQIKNIEEEDFEYFE